MNPMILDGWSVCGRASSDWHPPEFAMRCLQGRIRGGNHPRMGRTFEKRITTSAIQKINGRTITTESGSVYILGDVDPNYVE